MKDQRKLLNACLQNMIPAVVFQSTDSCAVEILQAAKDVYEKNGCSPEFLYDWQLLINEVIAYQEECPQAVKLPKLSLGEIEDIRKDMNDKLTEEENNEIL